MAKRRANRGQRFIVILMLVVTLLMAGLACALALQLYRRADPTVVGAWQREEDLTEAVRIRANAWLQSAALGERVDVGDALPRLSVRVTLELHEDGAWSRSVESDDLAEAEAAANKALAASLRELLRLRVEDAGRPPVTAAEAEERIQSALGLSTEEYLAARGPALLPDVETLRARFEGGGTYEIEGATIRFDGDRAVRYLTDDTLLVLSGAEGTEVYARVGR